MEAEPPEKSGEELFERFALAFQSLAPKVRPTAVPKRPGFMRAACGFGAPPAVEWGAKLYDNEADPRAMRRDEGARWQLRRLLRGASQSMPRLHLSVLVPEKL